jgi:hypothetical protein
MKSRSNLAARVDIGLRRFAKHMACAPVLQDGALSARVVGEFSAGKTRLLRELLGDDVPEALAPISSKDVQTRLPLELTYGAAPALSVVARKHDCEQASEIAVLDRFPARAELDAYEPDLHRLRLCLPLNQFMLHGGDGLVADDGLPRRLFLIDMPGWNSGEDAIAEEDAQVTLHAEVCLTLVYVSASTRLDSAGNRKRLREFLEALVDADFIESPRLIFVLTYCSAAEQERLAARARALVEGLWAEFSDDVLTLEVLCADFGEMPAPALEQFRQRFWAFLLGPICDREPPHPWVAQIRAWREDWDVRPRLRLTHALVEGVRAVVARTRPRGTFLHGMNMHRMAGLNDEEIRAKLHKEWRRQTEWETLEVLATQLETIRLPADHPLALWWREVWFDQARLLFSSARTFFAQAGRAIDAVHSGTPDLEGHLRRQLEKPYARLQAAIDTSFTRLVDQAHQLAGFEPDKAVATLLSLSAMQARYEQHYTAQLQRLRHGEQA